MSPSSSSRVLETGLLEGVKAAYVSIVLEPDSGISARTDAVAPDYLRKIRIWNFVEAAAAFVVVLAVVWCQLLFDKNGTWAFRMIVGVPSMLWMFVLSPMVHWRFERDIFLSPQQQRRGLGLYFWEFRGLGNPLRYYLPLDGDQPLAQKHWRVVLGALTAMTVLFLCAAITFSGEIDERYGHFYGDNPVKKIVFIVELLVAIDLGLLFLAFPVMLRLDNFARSLRFIIAFMLAAIVFVLFFNIFFQVALEPFRETLNDWHYIRLRGAPARERMAALADPFALGGQWSGYVIWGWIQQFIFMSYFGLLFSRAFDVARSNTQVLLACLCTATVFSLIHLPNVWLMFFTFAAGFFGTLYFLECRNLFAFGFVHGFGGSLLNKLAPINFSVGPDQIAR